MFVSGLQITLVLATLYETILTVRPTVDPQTELLRAPKSATRSSNLFGDYHWRDLPPVFVATSILVVLSRQNYICRDKYLDQPPLKPSLHVLHLKAAAGLSLCRAQELCENPGGRPGLPSLINLRFLWT